MLGQVSEWVRQFPDAGIKVGRFATKPHLSMTTCAIATTASMIEEPIGRQKCVGQPTRGYRHGTWSSSPSESSSWKTRFIGTDVRSGSNAGAASRGSRRLRRKRLLPIAASRTTVLRRLSRRAMRWWRAILARLRSRASWVQQAFLSSQWLKTDVSA